MQTLSLSQADRTAGGILRSTPAPIAATNSIFFGPLAGAFGLGFAVGTYIYNNFLSD